MPRREISLKVPPVKAIKRNTNPKMRIFCHVAFIHFVASQSGDGIDYVDGLFDVSTAAPVETTSVEATTPQATTAGLTSMISYYLVIK